MDLVTQFLTHIAAFALLIFLLKRFAWTTILQRIDERRDRIASQLQGIEEAKQSIETLRKEYDAKLSHIEEEARRRVQESVSEGQRVGLEIQQQAREEARAILEKARTNIDLEVAKAKVQLRDQIVDLVIETSEQFIVARLGEAEHRRLAEEFVQQLERQSGDDERRNAVRGSDAAGGSRTAT